MTHPPEPVGPQDREAEQPDPVRTLVAQNGQGLRVRGVTYEAVMRLSVEHPLLTPQQIAALLARDSRVIRAIMQTDAFLEERARAIIARYGDKITGVRGAILDTTYEVINAIKVRIGNPNGDVNPEILLQAAEFLMRFVSAPVPGAEGLKPGQQPGVSVSVTFEDLSRAQALQQQHSRSIDVTPVARQLPKPAEENDR